MPKVHLVGHNKPVKISDETADKLREIKNDSSIPDSKVIDAGKINAQKKELGAIVEEGGGVESDDPTKIQNLSTEVLKKKLGNFEEKYKEHESGELKAYNGLGVMDTGIHDWLFENEAISEGGGVDPELYHQFSIKKQMLEEYWGRKEYAEEQSQKEKEEINQKVKQLKSNSEV